MALAARTTHSILSVFFLLSLLATLAADAGSRCPRVPSMTAEHACTAVTGTRRMLSLCLRTLHAGDGAPVEVLVTRHAVAAVRGALESYAATVAAATSLLDAGEVAGDDEKAAVGDCMVGYGTARGAMARVAGELQVVDAGCGDDDRKAGEIKVGYMAGLRGMDGCRRSLMNYPASPLYERNLADRNETLLAALLCNLVVTAPLG
ncbi:hypothetical protein HU200_051116 [Digitaria exilis]|uniref:Pectinesterase inhibitor domain-containing protein n=1 Tax=Digitaria exilis TaxID=1010633 RepID=A0A835AVS8_9POAL|nr:hypothetical protein HU200_051116 [Digitaria exilis]CAB3479949.1 unnamed protein product [Digitaria exilis]